MVNIRYTREKTFTEADVQELFLSVGWKSGLYPHRLFRALTHSSEVFTAWDGDKLVGLLRTLDDSCMTAYLHYALVHPHWQGRGIASALLTMAKKHYADYLYINLTPEDKANVPFYERHGFEVMANGAAMSLTHHIEDYK